MRDLRPGMTRELQSQPRPHELIPLFAFWVRAPVRGSWLCTASRKPGHHPSLLKAKEKPVTKKQSLEE
jgi:hypothetical protein